MDIDLTCPECGGRGEVHSHNPRCWECNGKGVVTKEYLCEVNKQKEKAKRKFQLCVSYGLEPSYNSMGNPHVSYHNVCRLLEHLDQRGIHVEDQS